MKYLIIFKNGITVTIESDEDLDVRFSKEYSFQNRFFYEENSTEQRFTLVKEEIAGIVQLKEEQRD